MFFQIRENHDESAQAGVGHTCCTDAGCGVQQYFRTRLATEFLAPSLCAGARGRQDRSRSRSQCRSPQGTSIRRQVRLPTSPTSDKSDFEDAERGFIAKPDTLTIKDAKGNVVWDLEAYKKYIAADKAAPDTVNPSLTAMRSSA